MADDKPEDPLLRAGRRAKQAASQVAGLGKKGQRRGDRALADQIETRPNLQKKQRRPRSILFVPGAGGMPRHIAGREHEKAVLESIVAALEACEPPSHDAALHGARGLGKTVVLTWMAKAAQQAGVHVIDRPAAFLATPQSLFRHTLGRPVPVVRTAEAKESGRVGGRTAFASESQDVKGASYSGMDEGEWLDALLEKCREHPVLMLVDEAQTLDLEVAQVLLNAAQFLRRSEAPFALALAGTPHLEQHLSFVERGKQGPAGAKSSFWERLGPGDLRFGLLSLDEAADALRTPLELRPDGLPYDEQAVLSMASASDRYPYFVQLWGQQAEIQARAGDGQLGMAAVNAARPLVEELRGRFYGRRMEELRRLGLLKATTHLARLLADANAEIGWDGALAAAAQGLKGSESMDAQDALDAMLLLGALDNAPAAGLLRAGIPSFMQHVLNATAQ